MRGSLYSCLLIMLLPSRSRMVNWRKPSIACETTCSWVTGDKDHTSIVVLAFRRPFFFLASGCGLYGKFFCLVWRYQNLIFPSPFPFLREVDASSIITILWIFYSSVSCSGYFGLAVYFIPPPSPLSPPLSVIFIFLHIRNHLRVLWHISGPYHRNCLPTQRKTPYQTLIIFN